MTALQGILLTVAVLYALVKLKNIADALQAISTSNSILAMLYLAWAESSDQVVLEESAEIITSGLSGATVDYLRAAAQVRKEKRDAEQD